MVQETLANPVPLCCEPQFSTKGTADRRGQRGPIGVLCRPWHELIHELTAVSTWVSDCLLDCPDARLQAAFPDPAAHAASKSSSIARERGHYPRWGMMGLAVGPLRPRREVSLDRSKENHQAWGVCQREDEG